MISYELKSSKSRTYIRCACALLVAALAGTAQAAEDWWWGCADSDATTASNWWSNQLAAGNPKHFQASDVATYGGDVKSYVLDFGENVVTGTWATVSCSSALSYDPIVFCGTTGGLWSNGEFFVGGSNEGSLIISNGVYSSTGDIKIGQGSNGKGKLVIEDGELYTKYWFTLGRDSGLGGEVVQNGGHVEGGYNNGLSGTTGNGALDIKNVDGGSCSYTQNGGTSYFPGSNNTGEKNISQFIGRSSTSVATVTVNGGQMKAYGYVRVPDSGVGVLNVNGGEYIANNDIELAISGTGTLNVNGGFCEAYGVDVSRSTSLTAAALNLNGGVLRVNYLDSEGAGDAATEKATVNWNGGMIVTRSSASSNFVNGYFRNFVREGGVVISNTTDITIPMPLYAGVTNEDGTVGVDGGLTKYGMNSLALTGANTFTGKITVNEGRLVVAAGAVTNDVEVKAGAALVFDLSAAELDGTTSVELAKIANLTIPSGLEMSDCISVYTGSRVKYTLSYDSTSGILSVVAGTPGDSEGIVTTWLGGNTTHNWSTAANWSAGVPGELDTARFVGDAATYNSVNGTNTKIAKVVLANNANWTYRPATASNYPSICVKAIEGEGTITCWRSGVVAWSDATEDLVIPATVAFYYTDDGTNDAWLQGGSSVKTIYQGPVTIVNYARVYKNVEFDGYVTVQGKMSVEATTPFYGTLDITETGTMSQVRTDCTYSNMVIAAGAKFTTG